MTTDFGVSICIPTYNGEKHLEDALESALAQVYAKTEILLVDDSSTDNTLAIAQAYARRYQQVRVVENKSKAGMVANWMQCIEKATYPWIKFLFQDDVLEQDCIEKMMALRHQSPVVLCARDFIIDDDAPVQRQKVFQQILKPEDIFPGGYITPSRLAKEVAKHGGQNILGEPVCLLFNKNLLADVGPFNSRLHQLMDYEFLVRAGLRYGIAFLPESLVHFRVHATAQTSRNTPVRRIDASIQKKIRSIFGDEILLHKMILSSDALQPVREVWGDEELKTAMLFLYLRACREFGQKNTDLAFQDLFEEVPEIQNLHYTYLKYKMVRLRYNAQLAKRKKL